MKYKEYTIRETRLEDPRYKYRAKKGKNDLYEKTQESIKRLIKKVENNSNDGGEKCITKRD